MLKLLCWLLWWPEPQREAEFDIERLNIIGIERKYPVTVIWFETPNAKRFLTEQHTVRCSLVKHNEFVQRFRNKLNNQTKTK